MKTKCPTCGAWWQMPGGWRAEFVAMMEIDYWCEAHRPVFDLDVDPQPTDPALLLAHDAQLEWENEELEAAYQNTMPRWARNEERHVQMMMRIRVDRVGSRQ